MYFNEINALDQYSVELKVHVLVFYRLLLYVNVNHVGVLSELEMVPREFKRGL